MNFNEPGKDIKSIPNVSDSLIYFLLMQYLNAQNKEAENVSKR